MQDNFEVNGLARQQEIIDECIIAKQVYGKCKQKDFLSTFSPNTCCGCSSHEISKHGDLDPIPITALALAAPAINPAIIAVLVSNVPGDSLAFTEPVTLLIVDSVITGITTSVVQSPFCENGYWNVNITYNFTITLTVTTAGGVSETLIATTSFSKVAYLFGGETGNSTIYTFDTTTVPQFVINPEAPNVFIQAIVNPLAATLVPIDVEGVLQYVPNAVIGLFTIIKLYRIVNLSVSSAGPCELPDCETIIPGDPCKYFDTLDFPMDCFDPPSSNDYFCGE